MLPLRHRFLAVPLALLATAPLWAQPPAQIEPLADKVVLATGETSDHFLLNPDVAVLRQQEFLVSWDLNYQSYSGSQLTDWGGAISARKVSLQGQPVEEELILEPFEQRQVQGYHRMAADASGRFGVLWQEPSLDPDPTKSQLLLRRFAPDGTELETSDLEPGPGLLDLATRPALAMDPSGRFAAAWTRLLTPGAFSDLYLQIFDARATPKGSAHLFPQRRSPAVAMANGITILVDQDERTTYIQRFNAAGQPLGRATPAPGIGAEPAIAANANGRFVLVARGRGGIVARIYDRTGKKISPLLHVSTATPYGDGGPDVALDAHGNFVVVWQRATGPDEVTQVRARLFNRDGVAQGGELIVEPNYLNPAYSTFGPSVGMTAKGDFLVAWQQNYTGQSDLPQIQARLYAPLRDDDRCVWRSGTFLCDTARDGNLIQPRQTLGHNGVIRPLLADFDGDGIDDPCVRRGGDFVCDTPRDGDADLVLRFGGADATPLTGDLDGDGDDDPCVRRGRALFCDTAHNGGAAEVRLPLGLATDEAALGDVDGDGDDDPCIYRQNTGTFLCDTAHQGAPSFSLAVDGHSGDQPLLGDLDGDGRDDFCLARGEKLFCDLDRDGVLEEQTLDTEAGDVLLLGNVDGV